MTCDAEPVPTAAAETIEEVLASLSSLIFDCEFITVLSSDQLLLLSACSALVRLGAGQECTFRSGACVVIDGGLSVRTSGPELRLERGGFLTSLANEETGPEMARLVAMSAATILWIPKGAIEICAERNLAFHHTLSDSSGCLENTPMGLPRTNPHSSGIVRNLYSQVDERARRCAGP